MITNEQFTKLFDHYRSSFIQWHLHLKKYIRIDRDAFLTEFQLVLFKTMLQFNVEKATAADSRFERYFMSSVRKMCNTLLRQASRQKVCEAKKNVSFCLRKHDLCDSYSELRQQELYVEDVLQTVVPSKERAVLRLMLDGFSGREICDKLRLDYSEYRGRLRRLRSNDRLVRAVSRL